MAREKRKLPSEQPCLHPTEFMISQSPEPGSWNRMLEGLPYMSLARQKMEGKRSRRAPRSASAPGVKGVLRIEGDVDMVGVEFKVG